jgi:hypothetical protein
MTLKKKRAATAASVDSKTQHQMHTATPTDKIASYLMQNVLNLYSDLGMNFKDLDDSLTVDTDFEYTLDLFGKSVSEARATGDA